MIAHKPGRYKMLHTTVNSIEEARKLSQEIIESKLAACVQIIPEMTSIYTWRGQLETSREFLLQIKTSAQVEEKLAKFIRSRHSYETPEIISFDLRILNEDYRNWMDQHVKA